MYFPTLKPFSCTEEKCLNHKLYAFDILSKVLGCLDFVFSETGLCLYGTLICGREYNLSTGQPLDKMDKSKNIHGSSFVALVFTGIPSQVKEKKEEIRVLVSFM